MPKGPDILQSPSSSSSLFSLPPAQPGAVSLSNQKFTPSKLLTQLVELSLNIERTDVSNPDSHFPNLVTGQHGAWSISICHGAAAGRLGRLHDYLFWMFSFLCLN